MIKIANRFLYNRIIRKLLFVVFLLCLVQINNIRGQGATWPLNNTTVPTIVGCFSATNATVIGAQNPGFQTCGLLGYYADTWNNDLTAAPAYSQYFEFTMTTCPGWIATITNINVNVYSGFNNCAPHQDDYRIRYSTDGFVTKTNLTPLNFTNGAANTWDAENHAGLNINLPGNATLTIRVFFDVNNAGNPAIRNYVGNMMATGTTVLPIELTRFTGQQVKNQTKLEWTTASETNNSYFTIERSQNGMDFTPIKTVKGADNSNSNLNYSAMDEQPFVGINYYRLKQTDFNGQYKYSYMLSVAKDPVLSDLYPNPTVNDVSFNFYSPSKATANIQVLDIAGRIVLTKQEDVLEGNQVINTSLNELERGAYYFKVSMDEIGYTYTTKLIKN